MQPPEPKSEAASIMTPWRQTASMPSPEVTEFKRFASSVGTRSMPTMSKHKVSRVATIRTLYGRTSCHSSVKDARTE